MIKARFSLQLMIFVNQIKGYTVLIKASHTVGHEFASRSGHTKVIRAKYYIKAILSREFINKYSQKRHNQQVYMALIYQIIY